MKRIAEVQNEPLQLRRLAAQRQLYDEARGQQAWRFILAIPIAIAWAIVSKELWDNNLVQLFGSAVIAGLNIFPFTSLEDKFREKAAKIQELFDCDVLQIPWKREIIGIPPPADLVVEYADKYNPKNYLTQPLENWYTGPVDDLPLHLARIVCQRANLSWDAKLRRRYVKGLVLFLILLMALLAVMAWYIGLDKMDKLAYVIASFGPAATLGINEIITNIKAAASLDDLVRRMDELWHMAFSGKVSEKELTSASRDWQTQIFLHRKNSPVLLRWLYKHFRDPDEGKSYKGTEALVEEAKRLLSRKDIDKDNDTFP